MGAPLIMTGNSRPGVPWQTRIEVTPECGGENSRLLFLTVFPLRVEERHEIVEVRGSRWGKKARKRGHSGVKEVKRVPMETQEAMAGRRESHRH